MIQKRKNRKLESFFLPIIVSALIIILYPSLFLEAQERVKSLSIRQFEIEESIRNGLKYYLEPKDYVLRVKLFGEERAISIANETLPGFGQLNETSRTSGAKYWEITRMRVDLVMHKEVSPSVNTYIGEIVPILSGIDYERGDELVFVPILPSEPFPQQSAVLSAEDLPEAMEKALSEEAPETDEAAMQPEEPAAEESEKPLEEEPFWMRMSDIEKILAGMLLVLLLLFFWVLWKLRKVKQVAVEQTGFPALMPPQPQTPQLPNVPQQGFVPLPESHEKIAENNEHHDYQIDDALINDENEKLVQEIVKQLIGRVDWKQELVQEMSRDKQSMDMLTQFIATLGLSSSRKLFSETIPQNTFLDLEKLAEEAHPSAEDSNVVLKDIQKFLLTKQLTEPEQNKTNPFAFMDQLTTSQIGFLVKDEPAKIKAFVIARMDLSLIHI